MFMGSAMADFVEAMGDDERAEVFVLWLWMRAMMENAAEGVIKLTPARVKKITRGYAPDPKKLLDALISSGLLVSMPEPDHYYLANWKELNGEYFRGKTRNAAYMREYRARKRAETEAALREKMGENVSLTEGVTLDDCKSNVGGSVSGSGTVSRFEDLPGEQNFNATHQAAANLQQAKPKQSRAREPRGKAKAAALAKPELIHPAREEKSRKQKAREKLIACALPLSGQTTDRLTGADIERLITNAYGMSDITEALGANREFLSLAREEPFTWADLNHAVEEARNREPPPGDPAKYIVTVLVNARKQMLADRNKTPKFVQENIRTAVALGVLGQGANRRAVFADTVNPGDPDF
jgi:hypothetical protein